MLALIKLPCKITNANKYFLNFLIKGLIPL
jgi:hypothetical protein